LENALFGFLDSAEVNRRIVSSTITKNLNRPINLLSLHHLHVSVIVETIHTSRTIVLIWILGKFFTSTNAASLGHDFG
jgi:hypothetical protein